MCAFCLSQLVVVPWEGGGKFMLKSVRSLPSHSLALRYTSHHLDHFTSESSSSYSSSDHFLSEHTPPDTTDADTSKPRRFVHRSLARTPRCNEAYLHWRSVPLSTMYPPMKSKSTAEDSSFESSTRPSHKRCRSPAAIVALVPSRADLVLPRKRFRDSVSPEDSIEDIDTDVLEDIKADATAVEVAVDRDVEARVDAGIDMEVDVRIGLEDKVEDEVESNDRGTMEVGVDLAAGIDIPDVMLMPDVVERLEKVEEGLQDIYDHVIEIPLQRIEDIETGQRELDSRSLIVGGERASLLESMESQLRQIRRFRYYDRMRFRRLETFANMTIIRSGMTPEAIKELVNRRVEEALAAYEATRATNALEAENQSQNGSDNDNRNGGDGNGGNGNGGNGNPNENNRDARPVAREYQKLKGYAVKNVENKRRLEVNQRDNRGQQPPFKRPNVGGQNVARTYTAGNNERKPYNGPLPLCNKYKLHHEGPCTIRCGKCNKVGHLTQDCKSDCPKLKDQNRGNKAGNKNGVGKARGKAYVMGGGEANPDSNVVKATFLLNNHYASMIFDSGVDRSFVSTTFSTLLDITPDTLDVSYAVELADGRISETNTILRGCTLGLLGHPFNIDLMPVELGSFDVIIGMDWLANHYAVIVYDEKIMRIPYGDEVLIVQGDKDGKGEKLKLSIISCTKTQKYIKRGCPIFLAQVTKKETEEKSKVKRLEDVPTVQDFPKVFPEDLLGLPPTRQVEFQIDLVHGVAPVARTPYRLAPSELQELSTQLQELSNKE
ncbi:putative reverse transcriptase domain-containing protein [Tanacetum coccineum]